MWRYEDLLDNKNQLKSTENLKKRDADLSWWERAQLESRYAKDKQIGFYEQLTEIDKILIHTDEKLIKKLYGVMLEMKTQDEVVKCSMVKWAQNLGHNIDLDQWSKIWKI